MRAFALHLLLSAIFTSVLLAFALGGLYVTTAPALVSLLIQPFSLLLMPGLIVSLFVSGRHDFSPTVVLVASLCFYLAFFFAALTWWTRRRHIPNSSR